MSRRLDRALRLAVEALEDRSVPAAGLLDPTFGGDGRLALDLNPIDQDTTLPMVLGVQPDGKLLAAGNATAGNVAGTQLFRVNTDGTLDPTFSPAASDPIYDGGDGTAWLSSGTTFLSDPEEIVVQPDGKIVVVGNFAVVRLTPDGRPDPSFGTNGAVRTVAAAGGPLSTTSGHFYSAAVQPDGKILLAGTNVSGSTQNSDFVLARLNPDGSWDASFGGTGAVYTNLDGTDTGYDVAVQPDGRIVTAGSTRFAGETLVRFAAARYNPNGTLDTSFAGDGTFVADLFPTLNHEIAYGVALQSDGRIVLAGSGGFSSTTDFAAARLNPNGTVDTSFGTNGAGIYDMGVNSSIAYSVAVDAADRIVLGGWGYTMHYAVARLTPGGALDPTFDGDGRKVTLVGESASGQNSQTARDVAIRPDGSIVMSGRAYVDSPFEGEPGTGGYVTNNIGLQVMNPDGTPDTTFSGDGFGYYARQRYSTDEALGVALQPDGRAVVVGSTGQFFGSYDDFAVARLNPDGTPDATFGGDGDVAVHFGTASFASEDNAAAAVVQPDGKIVVVGSVNLSIADEKMGVARLNPDGTLDATFGTGGRVVVNPTTSHDNLHAVALQPDGKIVAAGSVNNAGSIDLAVIRLTPDGSLDPTFAAGGVWTANLMGTASERVRAVLVQPDGKLVLVGGAGSTAGGIVARLTPDGALDPTFNGTGYRTMASFVVTGTQVMTVYDLTAAALDPAGRVVAVGRVLNNPGGTGYDFFAARLDPNGSFDTSFDGDGYRAVPALLGAKNDEAYGVAVQQNGRIVIAGTTSPAANEYDFAAVRLTADGSDDTTFGAGGRASYDLSGTAYGYPDPGSDDRARAMALEPGGNVVVIGYAAKTTGVNAAASDVVAIRVIGDQLPTDLTLGPAAVAENAGENAVVGTLVTTDPDATDTHTYSIVPLTGGETIAEFAVVGNQLRALVSFDHEVTPTRTVRIRTTDQTGSYYEETLTVAVLDANEPPVAAGDAYTTAEDAGLVVPAPGVLGTDADPDGDPLAAELVAGPAHGTLALAPGGGFTYTPAADWNGTDSFTYRAVDPEGLRSAAVEVVLTVTPVDDPARASDAAAATAEDAAVWLTLAGDDGDPDLAQPLTFGLRFLPQHGTLTGFDPATGAVTYAPDPNWNGTDTFTFAVNDGTGWSAPATVTITVASVNDAPEVQDTRFYVPAGGALADLALLDTTCDAHRGAPDEGNGPYTVEVVGPPARGTLSTSGNGGLTYTPHTGFVGLDRFTYTITDVRGGRSDPITAGVSVYDVGSRPGDVAEMSAGEIRYTLTGVPDFDQLREAVTLPGPPEVAIPGLPSENFCLPTSIANIMAYFGNAGYPAAFAGAPTDWTPTADPADYRGRYDAVTQLILDLGYHFDDTPENGGADSPEEAVAWFESRGLGGYFTASRYSHSDAPVTFAGAAEAGVAGGVVRLSLGYYYATPELYDRFGLYDLGIDPLQWGGEGYLASRWRAGAHSITLVGGTVSGDTGTAFVHDPGRGEVYEFDGGPPRGGTSPSTDPSAAQPTTAGIGVSGYTQSPFHADEYAVSAVTGRFGLYGGVFDTGDGLVPLTIPNSYPPVDQTFDRLGEVTAAGFQRMLEGYTVYQPTAVFTTDPGSLNLNFLNSALTSAAGPVVTYSSADGGAVTDSAVMTNRVWHPYLTAGSNTVWRVNQTTGESAAWATLDGPRRLAVDPLTGTTFVLEATHLAALDAAGQVVARVALPDPRIDAIAYDDAAGRVLAFSSAGGGLYRFDNALALRSATDLGLGAVSGAADARTYMGVDPRTGSVWLHKDGATGLTKVTGTATTRLTVGRGCGAFADMGAPEADTGGPGGLTVDGRGHVLLSLAGRVVELDPAGNLVDSVFAGLPAGRTLQVTRSVLPRAAEIPGTDTHVAAPKPPVAAAGTDRTTPEGTPVTLAGTFTDADAADAHTLRWVVTASNGQVIADGAGATTTFVPADDGTYTATFVVRDSYGNEAWDTVVVTVTNVVQAVTITGAPAAPVPAGAVVALGGTATDPGADAPFTYAWAVNGTAAGTGPAFAFAPPAAGAFTVTLTVTDKDGVAATSSATVVATSANEAPVVASVVVSGGGPGEPVTVAAHFTDPDAGDAHTAVIDWGDGTTTAGSVSAGVVLGSHVYATGGVFGITVTVTDRAGESASGTATAAATGVRLTATGELQIVGTSGRDLVHVHRHDGVIRVHTKFAHAGGDGDCDDESDDEYTTPHVSHTRVEFDAALVSSVLVLALAGNDHVAVGCGVTVPARIDGGAGDDHLRGGGGDDAITDPAGNNRIRGGAGDDAVTTGDGDDRVWGDSGDDTIRVGDGANRVDAGAGNDAVFAGAGRDVIHARDGDDRVWAGGGDDAAHGGGGDDILVGGDGDDLLIGGAGRDLMVGGFGADRLSGNADEDIVIAGTTAFDADPSALGAIMTVWAGSGTFAERVAAVGSGAGVAGGHRLVGDDGANQTVFNDAQVDVLHGDQGRDWFFANRTADGGGVLDVVADLAGNELWSDTDF